MVELDLAVLFGSYATGRATGVSDLDVLVVPARYTEAPSARSVQRRFQLQRRPDLSVYSLEGIRKQFRDGTLFAWHLAVEAHELHDPLNLFRDMKAEIADYHMYQEDLEPLEQLARDVSESLNSENSLVYDGGLLAVVARNCAILLSHYEGQPRFHMSLPLEIGQAGKLGFPLSREQYELLVQCRYAAERGVVTPSVTREFLTDCVVKLLPWLAALRRHFENGE